MLPREMKRVYLVEDHPLMRRGLRMIVEAEHDFCVCGEASTAEEAIEKMVQTAPDIAIIDISLPGMSGLDLIKHFHHQANSVKMLVLSRHDETLYAERAIRAGARGYLMKSEPSEKIVKALRRIDTGAIYISPAINERLLQGIASGHQAFNDSPLDVLSDRELEVFEMTGRGIGTRDIAERLNLSVKTIESYRARVKTKLNLANASELMQHAVQWVESESLENRS
jgi:DNA-binding NarL/FixJ family response regulator